MKKGKIILAITSLIILASCSGVNNLKDYDLYAKKFYFDETISSDANKVVIDDYDYSQDKSSKSGSAKVIDALGSIGTAIGRAIVDNEVRDKLYKNSKPEDVVNGVSGGLEKTLVQYMNIKTEDDFRGDYDFIVNTILEELSLKSSGSGIYITIQTTCMITSRKDGKIVWENRESETVKLRSSSTNNKSDKIFKDIDQLSNLATLSDEEIRTSISNASQEVGRMMAEQLRKDISNSK